MYIMNCLPPWINKHHYSVHLLLRANFLQCSGLIAELHVCTPNLHVYCYANQVHDCTYMYAHAVIMNHIILHVVCTSGVYGEGVFTVKSGGAVLMGEGSA